MAGTLGGLIVTLGLDAAQFFTGLTKSEQQAKNFARKLDREIKKGAELAAAGFVIMEGAILGAAYAMDRLINEAANFKDIEERTGASAEALASFAVAAAVAGTSAADIGTAMNRLAKNLTGVDDESKLAGAALEALGLNIAEFKRLDPAAQVEALAKALDNFEDSGAKGAVAMALLGKAGAQLLPFFKELAKGAGVQKILSQEDIERADAFADAQKRVVAQVKLFAEVAAIQTIPVLEGVAKTTKAFVEELLGLDKVTTDLARNKRIREFAEDAALKLGFLVDVADSVVRVFLGLGTAVGGALAARSEALRGNLEGAREIIRQTREDIDALVMRPLFTTKMQQTFDAMREEEAAQERRLRSSNREAHAPSAKKSLVFSGAAKTGKTDDTAKRLLDQQLRAQELAIKTEQDALRERQHYLDAYYQDELIGFKEYYAERERIVIDAQRKIATAQTEQIAAARQFADRPGLKEEEKLAAEQKVAELIAKRGETERQVEMELFDLRRGAAKAMREYGDAVEEVRAQMLELAGDTAAAARIRFDAQNRSLRARAELAGDQGTLGAIDALGKQEQARVRLSDATRDYGLLTQRLGTEQARIELQQQAGIITTLDAINARSEVARKYVAVLEMQAAAAERAARAMAPGPEQEAALAYVDRLRLEIETLAESANELERIFRTTFVDAFASNLADVIAGTKSAKEAFKDFARTVEKAVSDMAAKNISEAIFGKGGPAGGASGFLSSLFGGGGGGSSWLSSLFGGGTTGTPFIAGAGGFAEGGYVSANRPVLVGERGPELFAPRAAGNIIPNEELMRRRGERSNVNISITVPGNVSRSTADQIALKTGVAVQRALSRNG